MKRHGILCCLALLACLGLAMIAMYACDDQDDPSGPGADGDGELENAESQDAEDDPFAGLRWMEGVWTIEEAVRTAWPEEGQEPGEGEVLENELGQECQMALDADCSFRDIHPEYVACLMISCNATSAGDGWNEQMLVGETDGHNVWPLYMGYPFMHDIELNGSINQFTETMDVGKDAMINKWTTNRKLRKKRE